MKKLLNVENYPILVFDEVITRKELIDTVGFLWGDLIKAVVDVEKGLIAAGGELHADEEAILLDLGSNQSALWGINLYLNDEKDKWLEYDSMINLRPKDNNLSRFVESEKIRKKIKKIVYKLIQD